MRKKLKNQAQQRGFTLIELLIVILIIGLLAGLGLSSFVNTQKKSRDSRRKQDLVHVAKALELYYNDFGQYPSGVDVGGIYTMNACGSDAQQACTWGEVWQGEEGMVYMSELPSDPATGLYYAYRQVSAGDGFYLFAHLENENDPEYSTTNYANINCGATNNCNYVLKSSGVTVEPDTL